MNEEPQGIESPTAADVREDRPVDVGAIFPQPVRAALWAALAKAQLAFGEVKRTETVVIERKAGGSYRFSYSPLENIITATRPALGANGLWLGQPLLTVGGKYVLRTILAHESGELVQFDTVIEHTGDIKALGSAITYMRRYCLQSILGIAAQDDDDGSAANGDGVKRRDAAPAALAAPREPVSEETLVELIEDYASVADNAALTVTRKKAGEFVQRLDEHQHARLLAADTSARKRLASPVPATVTP